METEAEGPAEAVLCAVVAHAGATLGARGVASAACVSRACRAAVGPHGVAVSYTHLTLPTKRIV